MPRPTLPDGMKVLRGTDQPSRMTGDAVDMPPADGEYPPPDWFSTTEAIAEWKRLVPILQHAKVLTEGDLGELAIFCALHGDIVTKWRAVPPTAALLSQYTTMCGHFGLNPASRHKVGRTGDGAEENPFKKHGKRGA